MNTKIRWAIGLDVPEMHSIEIESFKEPWSLEKFKEVMRHRLSISMVITVDDKVVGYLIYELRKTKLHIINIAIHPNHRRNGLGSQLLTFLKNKLKQVRNRITVDIRETNFEAQVFFRRNRFLATKVRRAFFGDEDAFRMEYEVYEHSSTSNGMQEKGY